MKLIVDSGSTKTIWALTTPDGEISRKTTTEGINPQYITGHGIQPLLQNVQTMFPADENIEALHFYGAGCVSPAQNERFAALLGSSLNIGNVTVESDLMGAARALFGNGEGIACILGTGSNAAYYDGKTLTAATYAGGFILGDEGSGAVLGRRLIADWIKQAMPADIHRLLASQYHLSYPEIVSHVYRQPYPNRYLAQFAHFIGDHTGHPYIRALLESEMKAFFTRNVTRYPDTLPVGFVGSIASIFAPILHGIAAETGYRISGILRTPVTGLAIYHSNP